MCDVRDLANCNLRIETLEERQQYMKKSLMGYLQAEVMGLKNINVLQEIYEHVMKGDNEEIFEQYKTHVNRYMGEDMREVLYLDMIAVLADKVVNKPELCEWFIDKIKQRYPKEYNTIMDYAGMSGKKLSDEEKKCNMNLIVKWYEKDGAYNNAKCGFMDFILFYYWDKHSVPFDLHTFNTWYDSFLIGESKYDKAMSLFNKRMTKKVDWTDNFLESSILMKYVWKQTNLLAEHMGLQVDELIQLILRQINNSNMVELALVIVKEYGIRVDWMMNMEQVWSDKQVRERIEAYYKNELCLYWMYRELEVDTISQLDIMRRMPERDYKHDFEVIVNSVVVDLMAELYVNLAKEYYSDFSFDKITKKPLNERYAKEISEYEEVVARKNRQIKNMQDENFRMKVLLNKKNFAEGQQEYIKELETAIAEKDLEIERLNQKNHQQDEFINLLSKEEDDDNHRQYDLAYLQTKRYLFVGRETKLQKELQKTFPNSVFMTSNTTNIEGLKVDAVVYLIKSMKHSMFRKVNSNKLISDIPVINYNGKRYESLCGAMYEGLASFYGDTQPKTA